MDVLLEGLRAAAEPTRLRILAILAHRELTVTELSRVLDQSQPRVSRHLKVLVDAQLLQRHSEGSFAFYRIANDGPSTMLLASLSQLLDLPDVVASVELTRDQERLEFIQNARAHEAEAFFSELATDWDKIRDRLVADESIEQALLEAVGDSPVNFLLDVGTGTGRMLEVFAPTIVKGVGLDISHQMLNLARSRLDKNGLTNCSVRHGSVYASDIAMGTVDVAILHHVLHFLDEPGQAIAETARTLRAGGQLFIVDFAPHELEELRTDHAHRRLGYARPEIDAWCRAAGLTVNKTTDLAPAQNTSTDILVTTLWSATKPTESHSLHELDVAS